eukprot:347918-Chlamydomonas_euryale.AAC.5
MPASACPMVALKCRSQVCHPTGPQCRRGPFRPCVQAGTRPSIARGGAIFPAPQVFVNIVEACLNITP